MLAALVAKRAADVVKARNCRGIIVAIDSNLLMLTVDMTAVVSARKFKEAIKLQGDIRQLSTEK